MSDRNLAKSAPPGPRLADLAGLPGSERSLDQELKLLIARHGAAPVREAVKRLTKGKAGRKPEQDWLGLKEAILQDARDWLDGKNPTELRSNYSIAKEFADRTPGQSWVSTYRRIMRKLAQRRKRMFLIHAWLISEAERPFADYFRACEALAAHDPSFAPTIASLTDTRRGALQRYRETIGEPHPSTTLKQIDDQLAQQPLTLASLLRPQPVRGLLGGNPRAAS